MGRDLVLGSLLGPKSLFQSTRPGWGATMNSYYCDQCGEVSIHAPRMGRDQSKFSSEIASPSFQSTRPGWGATQVIHSPSPVFMQVSIHAPRMGRDRAYCTVCVLAVRFQSTRPGWGATGSFTCASCGFWCFNPRAPDGARPSVPTPDFTTAAFQSTRPGWGATLRHGRPGQHDNRFQSTRPGWGATKPRRNTKRKRHCFNPRAPDGARPTTSAITPAMYSAFQSTRPGWGATAKGLAYDK